MEFTMLFYFACLRISMKIRLKKFHVLRREYSVHWQAKIKFLARIHSLRQIPNERPLCKRHRTRWHQEIQRLWNMPFTAKGLTQSIGVHICHEFPKMGIMALPRQSSGVLTLWQSPRWANWVASHHNAIFRKEKRQRAGKENTKKKLKLRNESLWCFSLKGNEQGMWANMGMTTSCFHHKPSSYFAAGQEPSCHILWVSSCTTHRGKNNSNTFIFHGEHRVFQNPSNDWRQHL